jgi:hypothetical protein
MEYRRLLPEADYVISSKGRTMLQKLEDDWHALFSILDRLLSNHLLLEKEGLVVPTAARESHEGIKL